MTTAPIRTGPTDSSCSEFRHEARGKPLLVLVLSLVISLPIALVLGLFCWPLGIVLPIATLYRVYSEFRDQHAVLAEFELRQHEVRWRTRSGSVVLPISAIEKVHINVGPEWDVVCFMMRNGEVAELTAKAFGDSLGPIAEGLYSRFPGFVADFGGTDRPAGELDERRRGARGPATPAA